MSLEWPVAPSGRLDQPCLSLSREDTNGENLENAHLASPHVRWRRGDLQPPGVQRDRLSKNTCVHIPDGGLRCVTWNTRAYWITCFSTDFEGKHIHFTRLIKNSDIICLQETHGKDEFLQAIQVSAPIRYVHTE